MPFNRIRNGSKEVYKKLAFAVEFVVDGVWQMVYPSFCIFCQSHIENKLVSCKLCLEQIVVPASLELKITDKYSMKVNSLSLYQGPVRGLLMGKFHGDWSASLRVAKLAVSHPDFGAFSNHNSKNDTVIIPIPLHWGRNISRGFNQASIMADLFGAEYGICVLSLLVKTRPTEYQSLLPKKLRGSNVTGAFGLNDDLVAKMKEKLEGRHFILVDDLCTTGSTLISAAKMLLQLKPKSISAAVICRVI